MAKATAKTKPTAKLKTVAKGKKAEPKAKGKKPTAKAKKEDAKSKAKKPAAKKAEAKIKDVKKSPAKVTKKTALEEKLEKKAKAKKAEKPTKDEAPAVHTASRTGKEKLPSILTSAAFVEMTKTMDAEEKKLGVRRANLTVGGHVENAISTGVLMYDFVMGGGYAPGRFTVAPGAEGSGKCHRGDTIVQTSRGAVRIDSLFKSDDPWDKLIPRRIRINTAMGPRLTSHVARRYAKDLYEIKCSNYSQKLNLTADHKMMTVNKKSGALVWKEAKKLKQDDILLVKTSTSESVFGPVGDKGNPKTYLGTYEADGREIHMTTNLARVLGVILADGTISEKRIAVSKKINLVVIDKFKRRLSKIFGKDSFHYNTYTRVPKNGNEKFDYHTVALRQSAITFLTETLGLHAGGGREKVIPDCIMRGNKRIVVAFLRAFFGCDYSAEGLASLEMTKQLAMLLLMCGIPSNIRTKKVRTQKGHLEYYTLTFGAFSEKFDELAYFDGAEDKNGDDRDIREAGAVSNGHEWQSFKWA